MAAYESYLAGTMRDLDFPEEELRAAMAAVPVLDPDTPETLAARVLAAEHRIYPLALKLVAEARVRIVNGRCFIDGATGSGVLAVPAEIA